MDLMIQPLHAILSPLLSILYLTPPLLLLQNVVNASVLLTVAILGITPLGNRSRGNLCHAQDFNGKGSCGVAESDLSST